MPLSAPKDFPLAALALSIEKNFEKYIAVVDRSLFFIV
jgi:hypothetical protein